MKIRSQDELLRFIEQERVWRIREIVELKKACVASGVSAPLRAAQRRAFLPLAYAHWEGFTKKVGQAYLDYVATQRLKLSELAPCFQSIYLSIEIANGLRPTNRQSSRLIIDHLEAQRDTKIHLKSQGVISTRDNLNSKVLSEICENLGFDSSEFSELVPFIDKILLGKRNSIAHGDNIQIEESLIDEVSKKVVECIDIFREKIENSAQEAAFRKKP
jgi:hypothetical protein